MPWFGWMALSALFVVGIAVAQWRGWIELRGNARGTGTGAGGAIGALDEVFAPTRHEAQRELQQQTELPAPAPVPGEGPLDLDAGRVRITLDPH
ncbi:MULTISPECIES: hypothetical protein [unclassified Salinibacterium]|uniref:hypothetical protein n=1 Tax=unclassified Salinibacterium TaxID=2632331 RepID=UPI00141EAE80|nr:MULTISPECIES: hypothetical protein [unclassified Salinibacterium]